MPNRWSWCLQDCQRPSLRAFSFREGILKRPLVKVKTYCSGVNFKGFEVRKGVWKHNKGGAALKFRLAKGLVDRLSATQTFEREPERSAVEGPAVRPGSCSKGGEAALKWGWPFHSSTVFGPASRAGKDFFGNQARPLPESLSYSVLGIAETDGAPLRQRRVRISNSTPESE
jgi:hypothetical protein